MNETAYSSDLLGHFVNKQLNFIVNTIKVDITKHLESVVELVRQTPADQKLKVVRHHCHDPLHSSLEAFHRRLKALFLITLLVQTPVDARVQL